MIWYDEHMFDAPAPRERPGAGRHLVRGDDMTNRTCTVTGCTTPALARQMCQRHYARWMRFGDTAHPVHDYSNRAPKGAPPEQSFWMKVATDGDCWEWQGGRNQSGYGRFKIPGPGGRSVMAHRFAYEDQVAPIPDGKVVCHRCDNPPCVRPDHLFVGSQKDNAQDSLVKNRHVSVVAPDCYRLGEDHAASKFTNEMVIAIRQLSERGGVTYDTIAAAFSTSPRTVGQIVRREAWKHAP